MGGGHEMEGEIAGIDRWDLGAIWKWCGNVGHWKICQGNGSKACGSNQPMSDLT